MQEVFARAEGLKIWEAKNTVGRVQGKRAKLRPSLAQLTHFCPPFQHLLSERLTSLGIMGEPRVPPLNPSETFPHYAERRQFLGQQMLERWAKMG